VSETALDLETDSESAKDFLKASETDLHSVTEMVTESESLMH
jgi:hypothetical protein